MSITSEYYFPSSDGKTLIHVNQWTPVSRKPRAVVLIAHGVSEYAMRYEAFAKFLCTQGFVVTAHDHLGHGQSVAEGAPRIYFGEENGWEHVVDDLAALQQRTAKVFPDLPCFVFGHSMGSFIARTYLIRYPGKVSGAIICGTGQQSSMLLAAGLMIINGEIKKLGAAAFSEKAYNLAFGSYNKPFSPARTNFDWLSVNEENVDTYINDPMCGEGASLGLMRDMLSGIRFITDQKNVERMDKNTPIFFISGDQDPVGDMGKGVEKACRSFEKAGVKDVSMKLYHGLRHEILNEKSRRFVYQDVLDWLEKHI